MKDYRNFLSAFSVFALLAAALPAFASSFTGACCTPDFDCSITTQAECNVLGGYYAGDDIDCSPNPCPCIQESDPPVED
jgi:hypothetical protein